MYSLIHLISFVCKRVTGASNRTRQTTASNDRGYSNSAFITDKLLSDFKAEYRERGNTEPLYQVPYLSELARRYGEKDDWASLLRAHAMYNSCAVREAENRERWHEKSYQVQTKYWRSDLQSFSQHLQVTHDLKSELEEIRARGRRSTSRISEHFKNLNCMADKLPSSENQELYTRILEEVPRMTSSLNQDMVRFTRLVIEKALDICGPTEGKYCVVALGSMARGGTTPYSDVEFLFLLETKSDSAMQYYQQLAVTIYFLIGNLGETKLKVMAIPELMIWDDVKKKFVGHWFDDASMSGFKIDGLGSWAGNIPTGGTPEQSNHLICMPAELAEKYKCMLDHPDPEKSLSGDLTAMLANTVSIFGEESLHNEFRLLINSYQPNEQRRQANINMLVRDAKKFDFTPDLDLTYTRQLKVDVYRYPSILILNLKIVHDIDSCDPWEIIRLLEARQIICQQTAKCLRFAFCCALFIRLSAYFYHDSQNENISVLSCAADESFYSGTWYVQPEVLIHMFIHLGPLHVAVTKSASNPEEVITTDMSMSSSHEMVALVRYYCHDHNQVICLLRTEYPDGLELAESFYQQIYIYSAIECSESEEAEMLLTKRIESGDYDEYDFCLLGRLYRKQCLFSQALESYTKRLAILISLHGFTDHAQIAWTYCEIGIVLHDLSKYAEALAEYRKCLDMRVRLYGDVDNVDIASVLCNIGIVLQYQSQYKKALAELSKCLCMHRKLHGDRDHVQIASVLYNIASVLQDQSRYGEALEHCNECLAMRLRLYRDVDHTDIVNVRCNIGIVHHKQSNYTEALASYQKALEMGQRIHEGRDHVQIANLLCNIGNALSAKSRYTEALEHYTRCLEMRWRIYGSENHAEIAGAICNIGTVYCNRGQYTEALVEYQKCLSIYTQIHGDVDHMTIADIHCNVGVILNKQAKYTEALVEYRKCLDMYLTLLKHQHHSNIADIYGNIGNVLSNQAKYSEALAEYETCLDMRRRIYGMNDHRSIAEVIYNIGRALHNQGRHEDALGEYKSSLDIFLRVFGDVDHSSVIIVRETIRGLESQL